MTKSCNCTLPYAQCCGKTDLQEFSRYEYDRINREEWNRMTEKGLRNIERAVQHGEFSNEFWESVLWDVYHDAPVVAEGRRAEHTEDNFPI